MSTITCPSCNASVPAGAAFCTSCGNRFTDAAGPEQQADAILDDETRAVTRPDMAPPSAPQGWSSEPQAAPAAWTPPAEQQGWQGQAAGDQGWGAQDSGAQQQWGQPAAPQPGPWSPEDAAPTQQQWQSAPTAPPAWGAPPPGGAPAQGAPGEWGAPAPAAAPSGKRSGSAAAGIIGIVTGIGTAISVFLTWYVGQVGDGGGGSSVTGWAMFGKAEIIEGRLSLESKNPLILLIIAAALILLGVLAFTGKGTPAAIGTIVLGLVIIGVATRDWMSVSDIAADSLTGDQGIDGGMGLYLAWAMGGVAAVGGVLGLVGSRKA